MIIDLYAGAGGWDEAARQLGLDTVGLEIWHDACVTAVRAGHPRIRCDIATYPTAPFAGRVTGLIASPPCQAWSTAGNRLGEKDKARVHQLVDQYAAGANQPGDGWADPRSHHAAQPVRWIRDLRPDWVCLEQVPPVLDLWRHIGDVLRGWGYSVWVGVLNAADYGVPQTRKRAVLIASRVRPVYSPPTTHEQDPPADTLFGSRKPWVSMADALGWADEIEVISNYGTGGDPSNRGVRTAGQPAATVTSKVDRVKLISRRDSPKWVETYGERRNRESDEPAPTITGEAHRWSLRSGQSVAGEGRAERLANEPAVTITSRADLCSWVGGASQQDSLRVSVTQAAILQSFPADYPWYGTKTNQFLQVGNAVPPGLAAAVLAVAAGVADTSRMDVAA